MENTPNETKKNKHIGWIVVAVIVVIALLWWGISAGVAAGRRNAAPLPKKVTASDSARSVNYRYDKDTRILYVTGNTTSWKWLIPFIDTGTPLGQQVAVMAASGDNVASIMVYYILSSSPTVSSGKVEKVKLALPNGGTTDYYFLTSRGKTTRINAFKVSYDGWKISRIGDRTFAYTENGLLETVGNNVLTMKVDNKDRMTSLNLTDTYNSSQYKFQYQYSGNAVKVSYTSGTESGGSQTTLGKSAVQTLTTGSAKYTFEISD